MQCSLPVGIIKRLPQCHHSRKTFGDADEFFKVTQIDQPLNTSQRHTASPGKSLSSNNAAVQFCFRR